MNGTLKIEEVSDLYGNHLEADTRVCFHAMHADQDNETDIVVRGNDTDILVILLTNVDKFKNNLWLDTGLDFNDTRKLINIKAMSESIKDVNALAGIYAFTGVDYLPSFYGKGKIKPKKIMSNEEIFVKVFETFGTKELSKDTIPGVEKFLCYLYVYKRQTDIHQIATLLFERKCKPKGTGQPLDNIKSIDPKNFPPCTRILREQRKYA